jgi:carbon-monoxide dehydrogenase medium subunit
MSFSLHTPATIDEATAALRRSPPGETVVLAGGTDLLLDIEDGRLTPAHVISLRRLPWRFVRWDGPSLAIGSTTPLRTLEADPAIRSRLPGLWEAIRDVGGVALRTRATIGGNLGRSSPTSDLLPVLLALEARVRLVGPDSERELPLDLFLRESRAPALGPAELIESVAIPEAAPSAYVWERVQPVNDISQVGVAAAYRSTSPHWRLALGGVPPRPTRLVEAEGLLPSSRPGDFELELAAQEVARRAPFVTDRRATEAYRRRLVTVLTRRAIQITMERAHPGAAPRSPSKRSRS